MQIVNLGFDVMQFYNIECAHHAGSESPKKLNVKIHIKYKNKVKKDICSIKLKS